MRRPARARCAVLAAGSLIALGAPGSAAAGDGVYGRLDGDLDLSIGAGAAFAAGAPAFAGRLSAVYAEIAGIHAGYTDSFGQRDALVERSIAAGITLKPLFWGFFANAIRKGPARIDLFIDSFIFELGAFWAAPRGRDLVAEPGLEVALGLGFPILENATGPFVEVRGALRYRGAAFTGAGTSDFVERGAYLTVAIAWHHIVAAHIADAGDRVVR